MRAKDYDVLTRAIEEGCSYGVRRAYKHNDAPSQEEIAAAVETAVISAICEVFEFDHSELEERSFG